MAGGGARGRQPGAAQLAGGPGRARAAIACRRVVYQTAAGEQSIDCDDPALDAAAAGARQHDLAGAAAAGDRSRRAAALSQPEADLHRAEAAAADRLPLGLPARRAVPRQPHVGAEERQPRDGAGRPHHPVHRAVAVEGRAAVAGQRRGDLPAGAARPDEDGLRRDRVRGRRLLRHRHSDRLSGLRAELRRPPDPGAARACTRCAT